MSVQHYRKDPRAPAEKLADEDVLKQFDRGDFLAVDPAAEREAIAQVRGRTQARRDIVASLGNQLGVLRRAHGLTQEQLALALGTKKSNISRLESGQYGGLTIEYFMAVLDAFRALGKGKAQGPARVPVRPRPRASASTRPRRTRRSAA